MSKRIVPRNSEADQRAAQALEDARRLPPGPQRVDAMRRAGRLRVDADEKVEAEKSRAR